jgi:hypothetical protein
MPNAEDARIAIVANQSNTTDANALPIVPVPRLWIANNPIRTETAMGTVYGSKKLVATFRPSTA